MKIKTGELTGTALDWAVAKCEGRRVEFNYQYTKDAKFDGWWQLGPNHWQPLNGYCTDWAKGGPIIEREGVSIRHCEKDARGAWYAVLGPNRFLSPDHEGSGTTPLIAAMRCYVASKLGDTVDVPEDLV